MYVGVVLAVLVFSSFSVALSKNIYRCRGNLFTDSPYKGKDCRIFIRDSGPQADSRSVTKRRKGYWFKKPPSRIIDIAQRASSLYNIPLALILAVINAESSFDPYAVSPKGAMGLMQLMPETIKMLNVKNPFDPEENVLAGTKYLRILFERYGNDAQRILAAYNAGPDAVNKYRGIPPYIETVTYVDKVIKGWRYYSSLYRD